MNSTLISWTLTLRQLVGPLLVEIRSSILPNSWFYSPSNLLAWWTIQTASCSPEPRSVVGDTDGTIILDQVWSTWWLINSTTLMIPMISYSWPSKYFDDWLLDNSTHIRSGQPILFWLPGGEPATHWFRAPRCFPSRKPLAGAGRGWDGISKDGLDTQGTGGVHMYMTGRKQKTSNILTKLKRFWLYNHIRRAIFWL